MINKVVKIVPSQTKTKLFAFDYDGTLFESSQTIYNHERALKLLTRVMRRGYHVVIITARDASFRKEMVPQLQKEVNRTNSRCFFGGANGTYLAEIHWNNLKRIYNYFMSYQNIRTVLNSYQKTINELKVEEKDLDKKGLTIFQIFLSKKKQWEKYITKKLLNISIKYYGAVFAEKSKISCVLPYENSLQKKFIKLLTKKLNSHFHVKGDGTFIHISNKIYQDGKIVDNKLFALQRVLHILKLSKHEVISFGDAPEGNDEQMLKYPSVSFTNTKYNSKKLKMPFYLSGNINSVKKVHNMVDYLISN